MHVAHIRIRWPCSGAALRLRGDICVTHPASLTVRASRSRYSGAQENGGAPEDSAVPCSCIITYGRRQSAWQLHRSVHPLDPVARGDGPARILLWHPGQYEVPTNDELRHQPARPETRPNQRLYVPLGSPPSVAVGSSSARAAHRSRAPQIDSLRMTSRIRYPRRGRACAAPNDLPPPCCADFAYRLGDYCLS